MNTHTGSTLNDFLEGEGILGEVEVVAFSRIKNWGGDLQGSTLLDPQVAADLLNVSQAYLNSLLDGSEIPCVQSGSGRCVRYQDLMEYKSKRDAQRSESLNRLTDFLLEVGAYDWEEDHGQ